MGYMGWAYLRIIVGIIGAFKGIIGAFEGIIGAFKGIIGAFKGIIGTILEHRGIESLEKS